MSDNNDYDINTNILGIYRTMVDSWISSGRYLSGIIMDSVYDEESGENVLMIRLALASHDGRLDSLVRVSFLHSVLLSAMEEVDIIVSNELIAHMLPTQDSDNEGVFGTGDEEGEEDDDNLLARPKRPARRIPRGKSSIHSEDQKIVDIARKIMSGKIKDGHDNKDIKDKKKK